MDEISFKLSAHCHWIPGVTSVTERQHLCCLPLASMLLCVSSPSLSNASFTFQHVLTGETTAWLPERVSSISLSWVKNHTVVGHRLTAVDLPHPGTTRSGYNKILAALSIAQWNTFVPIEKENESELVVEMERKGGESGPFRDSL